MEKLISNCCGASVKVYGGTFICRECEEPCELAEDEENLDIKPLF